MLQDYGVFNRSFLTREPYSTKTRQPGLQPCLPEQECAWHRLDALRFRSHPCFKLITDTPVNGEDGVSVWAIDQGRLIVTAKSGISFIELRPEGESFCDTWIEYSESPEGYPRQVLLTENDLRSRLPPGLKSRKLTLDIFSHGCGKYVVQDIGKAVVKVKMPKGMTGFMGSKYGDSSQPNTEHQNLFFPHAFDSKKLLVAMKIHHGFALDGLEFVYEDGSSCIFGKRGGEESTFKLNTRSGELLSGFFVRAGTWVDGIEILTTLGRRSGFFGNATGGSG
ncbi:MAG: hypothetical protein LQ340_006799 [Diploschistes diacapsis]|nr:MAG: hypothetical protein LQ340_006799 [Diploschistes diacapsis]